MKKYRNKQPSMIVHLHPTHFRFDQQDGSFSYTSPMKIFLEHLRSQTIPHDMLEEILSSGVRFYEGCLIVQVHDHKAVAGKSSSTSTDTAKADTYVLSSIHNYNEHLTPSPYVPFPKKTDTTNVGDKIEADSQGDTEYAPGTKDKQLAKGPKIFHVVLFPTPASLQEEVYIQANTMDPRVSRKHSTNVPRTPASATVPQTPLSAVPPTPSASWMPPNKKMKMSISGSEIHGFEAKAIASTAPPLFLDPVDNLYDAQKLIERLTDPRHKEAHPAPKKRKRTEAEMAADEAVAMQEQQFMLLMDENHGTSGSIGVKTGTAEGEAGGTAFQANFETFQAIKNIRAEHKARELDDARRKAVREQEEREEKVRREHQARVQRQEAEQRAAQVAQNQEQLKMQLQIQQQREMQRKQQQALAVSQNQLTHGHTISNGISQAQKSSPIVRNMTPAINSSPLISNAHVNGRGHTSSPARPPSAMQHGHPGGVAMVQQGSRQRAPSRRSTPQMNGTPAVPHATPRMSQGSPPMVSVPHMDQNMVANQHVNGGQPQMTDQQREQFMARRFQQAQAEQQRQVYLQQQQRMQNGSPNPQMSPNGDPQAMNLQHQAALNQQRQQAYRQNLQMHHQSMGNSAHPNLANGASPPHHPQQPGHTQQPQPQRQLNPQQSQYMQTQSSKAYQTLLQQAAAKYGGNAGAIPPQERAHIQQRARQIGQETLQKLLRQQQQQQLQLAQMQQMQQMGMNPGQMGGVMNGMGAGGGLNGQAMTEEQIQQLRVMQQMRQQQGMQQMSQMPHMGGTGVQPNGGTGGMQ